MVPIFGDKTIFTIINKILEGNLPLNGKNGNYSKVIKETGNLKMNHSWCALDVYCLGFTVGVN